MNINENNTSFISTMDKTNFICSYTDNGDLDLKFYIQTYNSKNLKTKKNPFKIYDLIIFFLIK